MADKIIIAIKDQVLRDLIIFTIQSEMFFTIIEVDDPVNVNVALIKNRDTVSVIYDDIFGETSRKSVIEFMKDNELEVPLYILGKQEIEIMVPGIEGMHEIKSVRGDYLEIIMEGVKDFFEEDRTDLKREYVPITFRTLTRLRGLTEDVYIKLSEKKYIKIYREHDQITIPDVEKYSKKGVDTLFLDKETSKWLLKELSKYVSNSINEGSFQEIIDIERTPSIIVEEEYDGVLTETQRRTFDSVEDIDPDFLENLEKRIDYVKNLASKCPEIEKLLKSLEVNRKTKNYFNTHNNLLSTVVCLLARKCEWYQEATLEKLVFAAQMHDLPLVDEPELAKVNDPYKFRKIQSTLEQYQVDLIENHASKMAELVTQLPVCPVDAHKIIEQHHELPNRTG